MSFERPVGTWLKSAVVQDDDDLFIIETERTSKETVDKKKKDKVRKEDSKKRKNTEVIDVTKDIKDGEGSYESKDQENKEVRSNVVKDAKIQKGPEVTEEKPKNKNKKQKKNSEDKVAAPSLVPKMKKDNLIDAKVENDQAESSEPPLERVKENKKVVEKNSLVKDQKSSPAPTNESTFVSRRSGKEPRARRSCATKFNPLQFVEPVKTTPISIRLGLPRNRTPRHRLHPLLARSSI